MPKMLAGANRKLVWVPDGGIDDVHNPKVAELNDAGVLDISCLITKNNFALGASGDESINDPAYCAEGNSTVPGNTNYEAGMDFFRWTTTLEDEAWNTFTDKGIAGFLVERIGKPYDDPFVATDKVKVVGAITGTPRDLNPDASGGYEKFRQEFFTQSELTDLRAVVAA
jgi:hypothetical protein